MPLVFCANLTVSTDYLAVTGAYICSLSHFVEDVENSILSSTGSTVILYKCYIKFFTAPKAVRWFLSTTCGNNNAVCDKDTAITTLVSSHTAKSNIEMSSLGLIDNTNRSNIWVLFAYLKT